MPHSAHTLNRYLIGLDGKTARQRLRGRAFKAPIVEYAECIWYLNSKSVGKDRMNTRWGSGIWLGIREESGETFVGTADGVIKTRSIRRKAGAERWNKELFNSIKGTPWEPIPGRNTIEVPINVRIPEEDKIVIPQTLTQEKDIIRRDFRIYKQDVTDHGLTPGCRGCLAADSNSGISRHHTVECRSRFMRIFESNPERMMKITEQYLKTMNQPEDKQTVIPARIIETESELPATDEDMADTAVADNGARGSDDPNGSGIAGNQDSEDDINMSNVIYAIAADKKMKI